MTYSVIPLQPQPNYTFSCVLDGQTARLTLLTTDLGLFASVVYQGVVIATSRRCLDRTDLNSARYNGLPQALFFADLQGATDPVWTGFNSRYVLCYGDPAQNGGTTIPSDDSGVSFNANIIGGLLDISFYLDGTPLT